jgi:hypothetical protein
MEWYLGRAREADIRRELARAAALWAAGPEGARKNLRRV